MALGLPAPSLSVFWFNKTNVPRNDDTGMEDTVFTSILTTSATVNRLYLNSRGYTTFSLSNFSMAVFYKLANTLTICCC